MPRPIKCRRICHMPDIMEFAPVGESESKPIVLTVDEYETIRLIDREGLSQESCGTQLGVGRTTVQKIYEVARKKIADALVCGCTLRIEGGDFHLCNGSTILCYKQDCIKRQMNTDYHTITGENTMRIAVTYENGQIFQHFGRTEQFKVYDVVDGEVTESRVCSTNGQGHGALADVLNALHADILICGGIGGGAQAALASVGIQLYDGVAGNADAAVEALLAGQLNAHSNITCNHHGHERGEGHVCGNHGCGHGECGHH